jgi:arylsulfatase A-like enzyme
MNNNYFVKIEGNKNHLFIQFQISNFIKIILLNFFLLVLFSCESRSKNSNPNVIIIITDDQGYGDLGVHGNKIIKTPNIDEFSAESVNFSNYHVGTTCSPTRAGLMTGRNCLRNGVWHTNAGCSLLNQEEKTIADIFSKEGYKTAMFGKWHLGDNYSFLPEQRGFDETFYHKGGGVGQTPDYWLNDYQDDTYFRNGKPEKTNGYCTDVFFEEAISFIKKNQQGPFLCYLSLNAPHSPYNVPKEYYVMYENESELLESQKRFYGMISNIDYNFGKLKKTLEKLEIIDNTILIFTTDNGTSNGYRYNEEENIWYGYNAGMRGTKTSEYDGGHRVPFIINWKSGGFSGGKSYEGLVGHVDVLPTLAGLTEIKFETNKKLDGIDLSSDIQNDNEPDRMLVTDTQRNQWPKKNKQSCVMYGDWRLVNQKELYNIKSDPGQTINLINKNAFLAIKMQNFYDTWWEDASKEFSYTLIDIEPDLENVLTSHDIHVDKTSWHQKDVRSGFAFEPGFFSVYVKKSGNYEIILRRWPKESKLPLNAAINDGRPSEKYWDELIDGKKMDFKFAYLILDEKEKKTEVKPEDHESRFTVYMSAGKKNLETGFYLDDDSKTTAFYTEVNLIESK